MIRTSLVCSTLSAIIAGALWASLVPEEQAAGGVSQVSPPAARSVGADQISSPGASATPAQQLSTRSAGVGAPASISSREAGRNLAAAPVQGRDRCDPAAKTASPGACADILDNRADDFGKPASASETATVDTSRPASGLVDDILKNGTGTVVSLPPQP